MALNFSQMLLQPSPVSAWNFQGGDGGSAREQLKLMREKFDWERKRAEEEDRLEREKMGAAMAQAKLTAEAEKAAKLQTDRSALFTEFTKASGEGNAEAMRAMVPQLHALGMDIELEGEEGGLPRYRIGMDAAAAEQKESARAAQTAPYGEGETAEQSLSRLGAMGLGGETGSLLPPLGIRSSDEVDPTTGQSVADRVAATYGAPGEKAATRKADDPDFTGGVPKNVIDMGAMADATLHRLDPALKSMAAAYPDEQTSAAAEQIRQGLRGSGLPLGKQMEAFEKGISGPASQRNAQIGADAQKERFRETRDELTETQAFAFEKAGRDDADKFATDNKIQEVGKALRAGDTILDVLDDEKPDNDAMIASELMTFQNVKGTPSDTDLKLAFDIPMSTAMDQALNMIGKLVKGGMQPVQKEAIKAYIASKKEELKRGAFEYLDQAHARAAGGAYNERAKKAYLQTVKGSVQGSIYNDWLDMKKARDGGGRSAELSGSGRKPNADLAEMSDIDLELEGQALEAGLAPEQIRPLVRGESGGKTNAANSRSSAKGIFQVIDSVAKGLGFKDAADYAAQPADKQIEAGLKLFKAKGLTEDSPKEDYALVLAAPSLVGKWKSRDEVVYEKGSDEWKINEPWRPKDQGDITIGSIADYYYGGAKPKDESPALRLPEPKTPAEKRYLELLKKRGG